MFRFRLHPQNSIKNNCKTRKTTQKTPKTTPKPNLQNTENNVNKKMCRLTIHICAYGRPSPYCEGEWKGERVLCAAAQGSESKLCEGVQVLENRMPRCEDCRIQPGCRSYDRVCQGAKWADALQEWTDESEDDNEAKPPAKKVRFFDPVEEPEAVDAEPESWAKVAGGKKGRGKKKH